MQGPKSLPAEGRVTEAELHPLSRPHLPKQGSGDPAMLPSHVIDSMHVLAGLRSDELMSLRQAR
jgi:hypothetical protein